MTRNFPICAATVFSRIALSTLASFTAIWVLAPTAFGAVITPPQPADLVSTQVTPSVTFDGATGLYTYTYSIKNKNNAQQSISEFTLATGAPIVNATSPSGWSFASLNTGTRGFAGWVAEAVSFDSDGVVEEPPSAIRPGDTLTGFSFQSPAPPGSVTFYSEGFVPMPQADSEEEIFDGGYDPALFDFTQNSESGSVTGPVSVCSDGVDNDSDGNVDLADAGCRDALWPAEDPACDNGVDDDADGDADYPDDSGCHHAYDLSETSDCSDGLDNNLDGPVDHPNDPGCASATDPTEDPDCMDGFDNDGDGDVDYPADDGCGSVTAMSEGDSDEDGVANASDNCRFVPNADQLDGDSDGVGDVCDNCLVDPNGPLAGPPTADQCDTDSDGYGNLCDGDQNGDGFINPADNPIYQQSLIDFLVPPAYPESDMNCDGFVNPQDNPYYIDKLSDFLPGPSGYGCAGTAPCPRTLP